MSNIFRSSKSVTVPGGVDNPVQDGLILSHVFCSLTDGYFHRNFAPGQPDSTVYGTVATSLSGNAARFTGLSNYIQTAVLEPRVGTILSVMSTPDDLSDNANRPCFYGTFTGTPRDQATASTTFGIVSRITSSSSPNGIRFGAGRGTSTSDDVEGDTVVLVGDASTHKLYTMDFAESTETTATDHTDDVTTSDDSTAARFPTDQTLRIGSGYATYTGQCDMTIFRCWNRVLTAQEKAAEVANARAFMLRLGVTV